MRLINALVFLECVQNVIFPAFICGKKRSADLTVSDNLCAFLFERHFSFVNTTKRNTKHLHAQHTHTQTQTQQRIPINLFAY